jgi:hypothetical protein
MNEVDCVSIFLEYHGAAVELGLSVAPDVKYKSFEVSRDGVGLFSAYSLDSLKTFLRGYREARGAS